MPSKDRAPYRFELTEEEMSALRPRLAQAPSLREIVVAHLRSPKLMAASAAAAARGAVRGLKGDPTLAWYLESLRVREVVPDAATGVQWGGDEVVLDVLTERLGPQSRVVDLGAGGGRYAVRIAPQVEHLVCVDISGVMLAEAERNLSGHGNVRFLHTSGVSLAPLPDAQFDAVLAAAVFAILDPNDVLMLLVESARILRPGGVTVFSILLIEDERSKQAARELVRAAGGRPLPAHALRPWTEDQLRHMCATAGLELVERRDAPPEAAPRTLAAFVAERR